MRESGSLDIVSRNHTMHREGTALHNVRSPTLRRSARAQDVQPIRDRQRQPLGLAHRVRRDLRGQPVPAE